MSRIAFAWSTVDGSRRMNAVALSLMFLAFVSIVVSVQPGRVKAASEMPYAGRGEFDAAGDPIPPMPFKDAPVDGAPAVAAVPVVDEGDVVASSHLAMSYHLALLELARYKLKSFPDYTCTFTKQERVDGQDLSDVQTMQLKLRHQPFSVYMKWEEGGDKGREVLFVDGQNDSKLLVKLGGLKGRLLPHLKLDPTGSLAMGEVRHPIMEMGLLHLTELTLSYRRRDAANPGKVKWRMVDGESYGERPCICFQIDYLSREYEPVYKRSMVWFDREHSIPVCVKNYGWFDETEGLEGEDLEQATLIELYGYSGLNFGSKLADSDFDKANTEYTFRR
jgi:hypothetical protein